MGGGRGGGTWGKGGCGGGKGRGQWRGRGESVGVRGKGGVEGEGGESVIRYSVTFALDRPRWVDGETSVVRENVLWLDVMMVLV